MKMATSIGLIVLGLLIGCVQAEQAQLQEQLSLDSDDLASQIKALQENVTHIWTYIYRLRQAIEVHLTDLTRRQSRIERTVQHSAGGFDSHGHHSHSEPSHHHEPLTSSSDHHEDHGSSDHHHDDHGSSDHHHDDHGSSDHHHDDHGSSDHHHEDHGSSDHHHDDHGSSDQHHDDHHHDSHSDSGDHHNTDDHHGDYHDDHHHGHHSSSESHSHTDDHTTHNESDHSKENDQDEHHHHHHHGDDSRSDEDQQTVQDVEKPFTVTVVRSHHRDHTVGTQDRATTGQNLSDTLNLLGGHSHHHHHHHHHTHQDQAQQTYDAKVTIPKYSDYRQYTFATCDVQPNRVISAELQQEVKGQVSFWQRKSGGPLNIHVRLRGFAIGDHHGHQQQQEQTNEAPLHGSGHRHGFHVHEFADLSAGCQSTGPHYNPHGVNHGGPKTSERHVGDLGNIECDDNGVTNIVFTDPIASLTGPYSIVGRALVIHSDVDDYGVNKDDPESLRTGNAGTRIACCIIQNVQKLPLATYKSMKLATNHQP